MHVGVWGHATCVWGGDILTGRPQPRAADPANDGEGTGSSWHMTQYGVIPSGAAAEPRDISLRASRGRRTERGPIGGEIPPLGFASVGMTSCVASLGWR